MQGAWSVGTPWLMWTHVLRAGGAVLPVQRLVAASGGGGDGSEPETCTGPAPEDGRGGADGLALERATAIPEKPKPDRACGRAWGVLPV